MPFKKKINTIMEMQRAEIERLQLSNESLNEIIGDLLDDWSSAIEKEKNKAIKEFAERLKEDIANDRLENFMNGLKGTPMPKVLTYDCIEDYIDNLVKEMTEVQSDG